jgi:hypothetical protein
VVEVLRRYSNHGSAIERVKRLRRHLDQQGVEGPPGDVSLLQADHRPHKLSQRLSAETVTAIIAAYEAGATTREVGTRFSLAHSSINKLLRQQDVSGQATRSQRIGYVTLRWLSHSSDRR